jgi:predicted DNA-binding transcriptional regulator AlpA
LGFSYSAQTPAVITVGRRRYQRGSTRTYSPWLAIATSIGRDARANSSYQLSAISFQPISSYDCYMRKRRSPVTADDTRRLIDEQEAAELLGMSLAMMRRWRWLDEGPRYRKIGRRVVYQIADIDCIYRFTADRRRAES